jgi:GT2 family glycosyltransferase
MREQRALLTFDVPSIASAEPAVAFDSPSTPRTVQSGREADVQESTYDCDVIIVNYNAGPFLARCVSSLPDFVSRVIVVDNGSNDDSLALLTQVCGDSRLHFIRNGRNLGFAAGCNLGIAASTAQCLLFLNPDCMLHKGSLQRMLDVLQSDPAVGMVGGLLLDPDGTEQAGGRRAIPTPWLSFVRAFGLNRWSSRHPNLFSDFSLHKHRLPDSPIDVEAISGALTLVRRAAMDAVGLWDEGYFLHCEDLDWCMRFRQSGWKIRFVPDAPVIHDKAICSRARPVFVEWHKHRGMIRFYRKFFRVRYPGGLFWLIRIGVWLRFGLIVARLQARRILPGSTTTRV